MKNFKNRPRFEDVLEYSPLAREIETWFEDCEKELKRKLNLAEQEKKRLKVEEPENRVAWSFWDGYARAIKEMLGEIEDNAK